MIARNIKNSLHQRALASRVSVIAMAIALWAGFAVAEQQPSRIGAALQLAETADAYYTVVLSDAPVSTYGGEIHGFAPAVRTDASQGSGKIDMRATATLAYVGLLRSKQDAFVDTLETNYRRPVEVRAHMQHALNAVILKLSAAQAVELAHHPAVLLVEREHRLSLHTDRSPTYIGAPSIWNGLTASGSASRGAGIVIGVIDTGVNVLCPAFAAVGPLDGHVHSNPRGTGSYLGLCVPPFADVGRCNDKLIGIYNFASTSDARSGVDTNGHGSHTASTAAGNYWDANYANGPFGLSGVAPHANVIAYLACTDTCSSAATSQAVNQALIDGVDVLNYSIGGGTSPWTDTTSIAFRNASAAGMFVATSAGDTSADAPDPQAQVNHLEPWTQTVAASTLDRIIAVSLSLTGTENPPANTQNVPMGLGAEPFPSSSLIDVPIIRSPDFDNGATDGCMAYPPDTFTRLAGPPGTLFANGFEDDDAPTGVLGAVAVLNFDVLNSTCSSIVRRGAALDAGAIGVIFVDFNNMKLEASGTSWSMRRSRWDALEAALTPATATVSIDVTATAFSAIDDVIAGFSLRGPRLLGEQGIVKPDIAAPGVDILAAGAANIVGANGVYLSNGTSMASPHMAGAAALMRAIHPTWTAAQLRSALNLSSNNFGGSNQDGSPVRLWDYGSGRVNLNAASKVGLIMDETAANFEAANPDAGGEISTLNLASMAKYNAAGSIVFTRTFRRACAGAQTHSLGSSGFPEGSVSISPSTFSINASGTRTVTITVDSNELSAGVWTLGALVMVPETGGEPNLHLPLAVHRIAIGKSTSDQDIDPPLLPVPSEN